jgi:hypothetical protein
MKVATSDALRSNGAVATVGVLGESSHPSINLSQLTTESNAGKSIRTNIFFITIYFDVLNSFT